jgi:hypothetical protein
MKTNKKIVQKFAKAITLLSFRNGAIENIHAGKSPRSESGDFSDVKVVTPYGEIPWAEVSRITDAEMKIIMQEAVNRAYTILLAMHEGDADLLEGLIKYSDLQTGHWDEPKKSKTMKNIPALYELLKSKRA